MNGNNKLQTKVETQPELQQEIKVETKSETKTEMQPEVCDENQANLTLANYIRAFHTIVVIFILLAPFSNIPAFLILHITFSISLLLHWYTNNNECSLTYLEAKLRGLDRTQAFTHKFIAPMYEMSSTEWSKICYIVTITLMCVSIYYLYNSDKVSKAMECFNNRRETYPEYDSLPFYQRVIFSFNCFKPLLIWC
jgi:hypothetical protein